MIANIIESNLQWLAGIVDSEGSIELRYAKCRRGKYKTVVRTARMRIKTCDALIVPKIAGLIGSNYTSKQSTNVTYVVGSRLRLLLPRIIPYLYTKQPHARLVLEALNIKAGKATAYSHAESHKWHDLYDKVKILNFDGPRALPDKHNREHVFSWPWLAGVIDGDGAIMVGEFGPRAHPTKKPILKIALAHHPTISYLANRLGRSELLNNSKTNKRRQMQAIRLMSHGLLQVLPEIIPYLIIKKRQAELALEIVRLRSEIPNGQYNHPNVAAVKLLLSELDSINALSNKSKRTA